MSNKILGIVIVTLFSLCIIALITTFYIIPRVTYNNTSQNTNNLAVSEDDNDNDNDNYNYNNYNNEDKSLNNIDDFENSYVYVGLSYVVEKNFSDYNPDISYDRQHKLVMVLLNAPSGTVWECNYGSNSSEFWRLTTKAILELNNTLYNSIIEAGYYDINCSVGLLSDVNPDKVLYGTLNGKENINFMSDY